MESNESSEDTLICIKDNSYLFGRAILAVIRNPENVLSKRIMLDILINHFMLNEELCQMFTKYELITILQGILPVMIFREVSVNRRIFQWLLCEKPNNLEYDIVEQSKQSQQTISPFVLELLQHTFQLYLNDKYKVSLPPITPFPGSAATNAALVNFGAHRYQMSMFFFVSFFVVFCGKTAIVMTKTNTKK